MNKQKMTLAIIGGVIGLAVLVTGYLVFSAHSAKVAALEGDEEGGDGLEAVIARAGQLSGKAVYPCAASVNAIKSNTTAVAEWREGVFKQASRGDRFFEKTTAAAFKTMIVADAKRLQMLPGTVENHICKRDFAFGPFRDYIAGGKMPEEAALPVLQRQWDDIAAVIETLSKNGIGEVMTIDLKVLEAVVETAPVKGKNAKNAKKPAKAKAKPAKGKAQPKADKAADPIANTYVVTCKATPAALVQTINAFATSERFVVVDDFGFVRPQDTIVQALGGEVKKTQEKKATSSRRRRRGGGESAEVKQETTAGEAEKAKKSRVVTDPALNAPLTVTLQLTVCDFRTAEDSEEEAKAKGEGEGKAKGEEKAKDEEKDKVKKEVAK